MKNRRFNTVSKKVTAGLLGTATALSMLPAWSAAAASSRVESILSSMSLRDKITQTMEVDFRKWDMNGDTSAAQDFTVMNDQVAQIIEDYNFGAIILFANNVQSTDQSFNLVKDMQDAATRDGGLPLIISTDQEGGIVSRLGTGCAMPGNMALGATDSEEDAKTAGEIIGSELSSLGINTALAPVVDVNNNPANPVIGLRSYGENADRVGALASAEIDGLKEYNVIGCAKHFPGHGDVATDSHYGLPVVNKSKDVLMENELKPYKIAIDQGIEMIMTAHILFPGLDDTTLHSNKTGNEEKLPATMSKAIITDLLKDEMGFTGIVSTDAMNMAGISANWDEVQAVVNALKAGIDLVCMPTVLYSETDLVDLDAILDGVEDAVKSGELPESRLDDACRRILTVKENRGILDYNPDDYSIEKARATVGSAENREKERQISANAVTVVKNENNLLPLDVKSGEKVVVMTPWSNEPTLTVMAWNRAIQAGTIPADAEYDYMVYSYVEGCPQWQRDNIDKADYVVVLSEVSSTARYDYSHWQSNAPKAISEYCKETGKPCIVMSCDKPYETALYPAADAVLAVYGNKGSSSDPTETLIGGVTGTTEAYGPNIVAGMEVILGTFGAKGKLPVTVPSYENGGFTDNVVYPYGFGIETVAKKDIPVTIKTQPVDFISEALNDNKATASVEAEGPGCTVTWFVKNPGEEEFSEVPASREISAVNDTYTVTLDDSNNGQQVFARVTSQYGNSVDSNTVTLENKAITAKKALEAQIAEGKLNDLKADDYTDASFKSFKSALDAADKAMANEAATAKDLTDAAEKLDAAVKALDRKVTAKTKEELKKLVESYKQSSYTADSWKAFEASLKDAKAVLNSEDAGENETKAAIADLKAAAEKLVKKSSSSDKVNTAATYGIPALMGFAALAVGGLYIAGKKQRKDN